MLHFLDGKDLTIRCQIVEVKCSCLGFELTFTVLPTLTHLLFFKIIKSFSREKSFLYARKVLTSLLNSIESDNEVMCRFQYE